MYLGPKYVITNLFGLGVIKLLMKPRNYLGHNIFSNHRSFQKNFLENIMCSGIENTGCPGANIYISICSDRQKYSCQIWFDGGLGILNSGNLTYDPSVQSKVTSLLSTASKRKGEKNLCKKEFECTLCKDIFKFIFQRFFARLCLFNEKDSFHFAY